MKQNKQSEKERQAFKLRKAYYKLRSNYYGLLKHNMLTPRENKVMLKELQDAEKAWKNAEA